MKHLKLLFACACLLLNNQPVAAAIVPTHGGVVHLDPLLPGAFVPVPVFPAVVAFAGMDGFAAPAQPWHWENEFQNPGAAAAAFPIIFGLDGVFPVLQAGILALPALGVALFDIHVFENLLVFGGPDVGGFTAFATRTPGALPLNWDVAVTEDVPGTPTPPSDVLPPEWTPRNPDEITQMPHYRLELRAIPEPSATALLLLGLACLSSYVYWVRRRGLTSPKPKN